jgi:hypothetical protein
MSILYAEDNLMRFSIRDLLWATLVAAICFAWWRDHREAEAIQKRLVEAVNASSSPTPVNSDGSPAARP